MIVEHAVLEVRPGQEAAFETALQEALVHISSSPGFGSLRVARGIESASRYILVVEWDTLEAHTEGFRGSPAYDKWRAALHHFYEPFPTVEHFTVVAEA
ncbi:MAG: antibiotic biosynthesis monooxygenase [Actinomycetes bacterium]